LSEAKVPPKDSICYFDKAPEIPPEFLAIKLKLLLYFSASFLAVSSVTFL
jgi:hypothetical protein